MDDFGFFLFCIAVMLLVYWSECGGYEEYLHIQQCNQPTHAVAD